MPKITLDAETFKVLASDTRLQILKSLDERPKTVSELGRELTLNKATVHEHLQQLLAGELIKKNEREGRKWVYYQLSWKGKSLLHPENTTVMILLGFAAMGSAGAIVQLGNWLRWWGMDRIFGAGGDGDETSEPGSGDPEAFGAPEEDQRSGQEESQAARAPDDDMAAADSAPDPWYDFLGDGEFWIFAILFLMASVAVVAAMYVKKHAQGRDLQGTRDIEEAEVRAVKGPKQEP